MQKLGDFFEKFINKESIFINKKVLQSNYIPESIFHRDEQINNIAGILAPSLKLERPSNLFIYGKTGTGKTLTITYVTNQIKELASQKDIPVKIFYLNCKLKKIADTEYRLLVQLAYELGKQIPPTGLPTDEVYKIFFNIIDEKEQLLIIILDEIDQLVKRNGDSILYNLTRINTELKKSQIALIGISNNLTFIDELDPRVKSSLSEEEIIFPPYNAIQLQSILKDRVKLAFKDNSLEEGLIEKCAAFTARDHGDARRAIELLRVASEIAERNNEKKVLIKHLDEAEEKIERDRFVDIIEKQPKQFQVTLYSILIVNSNKNESIYTGDVYDIYKQICLKIGLRPLTQRRISDIIAEFDSLGVINVKLISKGRYGRTREISSSLPSTTESKIKKILEQELDL